MPVKSNKEEFILKANKIHNNKYDYSFVIYTNSKSKIGIICERHGVFNQTPNEHLSKKSGCPSCSGNTKYDKKTFIKKSNHIFNNKYDYSLISQLENSHSKIKIICPIHHSFIKSAYLHIQGQGCPKCSKVSKMDIDLFIKRANIKHNYRYDYSNVKNENKFMRKKISIRCVDHGIFEQRYTNHLYGQGCPKCCSTKKYTLDEFKLESSKKHNNKYNYNLVNFSNLDDKIEILCPNHGSFFQTAVSHNKGIGCPKCKSSKGEIKIREILSKNQIKFIEQYKFDNCKFKNKLKFDFYLPEYKLCIEYNGKQHYKPIEFFGGEYTFEKQKIKDTIKTIYCNDNNIKLLNIKYNDDVETSLCNFFNFS